MTPTLRRRSMRALLARILPLLALLTLVACGGARGGRSSEGLDFAGRTRSHSLKVPAGGGQGRPLLLVLHGGGGTNEGVARATRGGFDALADKHRFVLVYPQGIDKSWNDGRQDPISTAHRDQIDDVGYLTALIDDLHRRHGIDRQRVFVTGVSNGGFMAQRMACDRADRVAGVVSVTAQLSVELALINGTDDPLVPYDGGFVTVFGRKRGAILSTDATLAFWRQHNGCEDSAPAVLLPAVKADGTTVFEQRWRCAGAPVALLRIDKGGHAWPGGKQYLPQALVGKASAAVDASAWIWAFFAAVEAR